MGVIDDIILTEARKSGRTATKSSVDKAISDAAPGLKAVASRVAGAEEKFVKWAMKSAKLTKPQAEKALATMRKLKVVKIDANVGQFTFKHGAFAEPEVVRRAAGLEEDSMSNSIDDIVLEDVMGKTMGFAPPPKVKSKAKAKVGGTVSFVNPDTGKTQKLKVIKIDGTTIWAKGKGGAEYSIVMAPGSGDPENVIRWPTRRGSFPANPRYKKGSFKFEGVELPEGIDPQGKGENKDGDTDVMPAKDGKWNVFQKKDGKWKKVAGPFDDGDAAKNAAQKIEKAKSESLDEAKIGGMGKWGKSRKDLVKILDKGSAPDKLTMESIASIAREDARGRFLEEDFERIADASINVSLESMPRASVRRHAFGAPNLEYGIMHEENEYLSEALPNGSVESFLLVMQNQLIAQDKTEMKRALRARRPDNPYRLGLFMKALNAVRDDVKDIMHNEDKESLERLKTSLSRHFTTFPPYNRTIKAIDKFITTGKKPTLTKLKEHASTNSARPDGGPIQESLEDELSDMIAKCTPDGVPSTIMEDIESSVSEVIDDLTERKSKGDYGRGAGGRSSELSWKSGPKPGKDAKKAASKGERRGKKDHIDAQMRGEGTEDGIAIVEAESGKFYVYRTDRNDPIRDDSEGIMSIGGGSKLLVFRTKQPDNDKYSRKLVWQGNAKAQGGNSAAHTALMVARKTMHEDIEELALSALLGE